MVFEWDDEKERKNIAKHGIRFTTAARVFSDENRIERFDAGHSEFEDRYMTIGLVGGLLMVLAVVYTERGDDVIRIISARTATKKEKEEYYGYR
jgi:uncharacterized DUF497 family protein